MIEASFFLSNREAFLDRIPKGTAVFLFSGSSALVSSDMSAPFLVDRNFYYLTGIERPGLVLLITRNADSSTIRLFAPPKDELKERWEGSRQSFEELSNISLIDDVVSIVDFPLIEGELNNNELIVALDSSSPMKETREYQEKYPDYFDISPILTSMRMIKKPCEVEAIRKAAKITEEALMAMKEEIVEGASEKDLYARLNYELMRRDSFVNAFETIVSIDSNTFFLHHSEPEDKTGPTLKPSSMIQIDVGARIDGYCADISRVYILKKNYDKTKCDRYEKLVSLIQILRKEAIAFIRPGENFNTLNRRMMDIVGFFLLENGLIKEISDERIKDYYWHNTSHHLGLDVHDTCVKEDLFAEGNCLALEPGVYIKEWGIGFRIEDDVEVTSDGCMFISSGNDSWEDILVE